MAYEAIAEAAVVFVSVASAWEIALKQVLGRLQVPGRVEPSIADSGFERLPISFAHAEAVETLPLHHHDPFDRILIAQAQIERLTLVTRDPHFRAYEIDSIRA
jgi:PIN domain nuclease of toxin-antitoxin system